MNAAHFWQYFQWLFVQGLGIVALPKFGVAAVLLAAGLVAALVVQNPFGKGRWKSSYWFVLTQCLFYPAVIAVGVIFAAGPRRPFDPLPKVPPVADMAMDTLTVLSLALGIFWIYRLKGLRWITFCFVALQLLFLCGALFVAGMSITGDWI